MSGGPSGPDQEPATDPKPAMDPSADAGPVIEAEAPQAASPQAAVPPPLPRDPVARFWSVAAVPIAAVVLALLVGSLIILASSFFAVGGFEPLLPVEAYSSLLRGSFGSVNGLVNTVVAATPLVLAGLAVGIGFKAGLFNIGAQGQFLMGALAAAGTGAALAQQPPPIAIGGALLAAAIGGGLWGFIPGALKAWTGAHEVVTTIMLNYIAAAVIGYLITGPLAAPGFSFARTGPVGNAALPIILGRNGHLGILIALLAVPLAYWLLWRSTLGFELRTVGANPNAARYAGMRPGLLTIFTLSLCGLLAGLAGGGQILGTSGFMNASYGTATGFDAIAVALLGRAHPVGILAASLLFGAMRAGSGLMQIEARIPVEIIDVIQAVILLFLAADVIVRRILRLRAARSGVDEIQTVTRSYGEQAAR
ncbi:MAG: ABC transporter permease [Chloroflexi bacterium]|nr:ABC transporter permease [Chloroflexota bacterium]